MMQSEFTERTGVNLTAEEYAKVEHIYNSVQMDKDRFCELWEDLRDNQMVKELMDTISKLEDDCKMMRDDCEALTEEMEGLKAQHAGEMDYVQISHRNSFEGFAKKLIKAGEYNMPSDIYDAIEEEFGMEFIIRSKWEQNIELQEEEIDYMVKKLTDNKRVVA